jgi:urease beta subunit
VEEKMKKIIQANPDKVRILVKDSHDDIIDVSNHLYFFEENGIEDLNGEGRYGERYTIYVEMDEDV